MRTPAGTGKGTEPNNPNLGYEGLRLVPKPAPKSTHVCLYCGRPMDDGRKKYCKPTHKRKANDKKWGSAGLALYERIVALSECPTPTLNHIKSTLAAFGMSAERRARRNALMSAFGFVYDAEKEVWERVT